MCTQNPNVGTTSAPATPAPAHHIVSSSSPPECAKGKSGEMTLEIAKTKVLVPRTTAIEQVEEVYQPSDKVVVAPEHKSTVVEREGSVDLPPTAPSTAGSDFGETLATVIQEQAGLLEGGIRVVDATKSLVSSAMCKNESEEPRCCGKSLVRHGDEKDVVRRSNGGPTPNAQRWNLCRWMMLRCEAMTGTQQVIVLTSLMFLFFGAHNVLQETMMNVPNFRWGVMLGYMEVVGVTIGSYVERRWVMKERGRVAPLKAYPLLTGCLMISSSFSNMSLNYINFPTKVVFRSCKLIPTMLIATCVNKRIFSCSEYIAALAVCLGLVFFAAADWTSQPSLNVMGLGLVSGSVCADAFLPNAQERLFCMGASRLEVTVYTNLFALLALTATTFLSGDLLGILRHAAQDESLATLMLVYVFVSYAAITTYMNIVKRFGGVSAVLLATARKGMSLVLSFLFFPKKFSWFYVSGAILVLGGLMAASLLKQMSRRQKATEPASSTCATLSSGSTGGAATTATRLLVHHKLERKNSFPETQTLLQGGDVENNHNHEPTRGEAASPTKTQEALLLMTPTKYKTAETSFSNGTMERRFPTMGTGGQHLAPPPISRAIHAMNNNHDTV